MSINKIEAMQAFIAVAEEGGFSAAARKLRVQQSALSRIVSSLESEFATSLMTRTTRKLALTEAGHQYLQESKRLLAELADLEARMKKIREEPRGILRINLSTAFGKWVVVPILAEFKRNYPDVVLEIHMEDRLIDLVSEGFDVVIRVGASEDSRVTGRKVAVVRRGLFLSKQLLKKNGPISEPSDLSRFPAIHFDDRVQSHPKWTLGQGRTKQTVSIPSSTVVNQLDGVFQLACDGLGVAQLPLFIASGPRASDHLVRVLPEWDVYGEVGNMDRVYALFTGGKNASAKVRVFVDFLVNKLSQDQSSE